jgi:cob(I)alamin adenosyltransferase
MATKIYTRTGDKGTTSLIGGTKVPKSHLRIEAYGTIDELNSHIGLCRDVIGDARLREILLEVQDRLLPSALHWPAIPSRNPNCVFPISGNRCKIA